MKFLKIFIFLAIFSILPSSTQLQDKKVDKKVQRKEVKNVQRKVDSIKKDSIISIDSSLLKLTKQQAMIDSILLEKKKK